MAELQGKVRNVKLAALVLTPHIVCVKEWLENYFGYTATLDYEGPIYCRNAGDEICLVETLRDSQLGSSAIVVLLVDDIDALYESFIADGIKCSFSRDIAYRPSIDFDCASPFAMFQIEERDP